MNIGDKIKEQRLKKEWTQEHLAQLLNVSRPTVSSWEVHRNYPDLETIIAISDLFGISLDDLLREDKEMAKDTTNKLKRGKIYKIALMVIAGLVALYGAYNFKLRSDEKTYRQNLEANGWEVLQDPESLTASGNAYELNEDGINYWTYILPAGWVGFPLKEQQLTVITREDNFGVTVDQDGTIGISISPENDDSFSKQLYVDATKEGQLKTIKENWSEDDIERIKAYLTKYGDTHRNMIEKSFKKIGEISGKK